MKSLLAFMLFLASLSSFSQEEWELIHGSDDAFSINNAFMVDSAHIWGQENHSFYSSNDFGNTWTQQFDYDTNSFISTYFTDTLHGWACGGDDVIHTEDGGLTWEYQVLPNDWYLAVYAVFFLNQDTGWIAGSYMTIFVTYDGGDNWIKQHDSISTNAIFLHDIYFYNSLHGCAVGGILTWQTPVVMTTSDGGNHWSEIIPPGNEDLVKVRFSDATTVWAIDGSDELIKSTDQGYTWEVPFPLPYFFNPKLIHFFNENEAIIADPMSIELAFTDDAWDSLWYDTIYYYNHFNQFSFAHDRKGIASGWGNLLRTGDGGNHWERINERFVRIALFDQFNGWIIPEYLNKKLLHTTDGGLTWNEVATGHTGTFHEINFTDDHTGFVLTDEPQLLKTTDAGGSWEIIDLPFSPSFYFSDLQFLDEDTGFIAAYPDLLYKTLDGGENWEYDTLYLTNIGAIDFLSSSEGWVVDHMGHVAHTADGGDSWNYSTLPVDALADIDFINSLDGFVLTGNGILYRSNDGGDSWEEQHFDGGSAVSLNFEDELNGWILCEDEVYRTYDGGISWNLVLENTSVNSVNEFTGFFALDTSNAWICSMDGRVLSCADFVGIEEDEMNHEFSIYPNPASDLITIGFDNQQYTNAILSLYSFEGKLVLKKNLEEYKGGKTVLDISIFPAGIYFVRISKDGCLFTKKILKM